MNDLAEKDSAQEGFKIAPFKLLPRWQIFKRRSFARPPRVLKVKSH